MNQTLQRRWVRWVLTTLAAVLAITCLAGALIGMRILATGRADIAPRTVAAISPSELGPLSQHTWMTIERTDEDGLHIRGWESNEGYSLFVEVWKERSPVVAEAWFRGATARPGYRRDFADIHGVKPPSGLDADSVDLFCGKAGTSQTDQLEDCTAWGASIRYGQYLVYFKLYGVPLQTDNFKEVILVFDQHTQGLLD